MFSWNTADMRDRLELVYRRAMDDIPEAYHSASWYQRQSKWIRKVATEYDIESEVVAGMVAVMSPQVTWEQQVNWTPRVLDQLAHGEKNPTALNHPGFITNKTKAFRIYESRDPESILSGPKVTAFWSNLCGNLRPVTVDTHMVDAALGLRSISDREGIGTLTDHRYRCIAEAVTAIAASSSSFEPAEVQAIIWTYRRDSQETM